MILFATKATACECLFVSVKSDYKQADVVFYGKVVKVMDKSIEGYSNTLYSLDDSYLEYGGHFPLLKVIKRYKGNKRKYYRKDDILIYQNWSLCDKSFKLNQYYLVFGFLDENGKLTTSSCTATREFALENFENIIDLYLK